MGVRILKTCSACGWVHMGLPRDDIVAYHAASGDTVPWPLYEKCFRCEGSYTNMRSYRGGDCPVGCSLQPILLED